MQPILTCEAVKLSVEVRAQVAMDASRKDDTLDENEDGIADVKQIDTKQVGEQAKNAVLS